MIPRCHVYSNAEALLASIRQFVYIQDESWHRSEIFRVRIILSNSFISDVSVISGIIVILSNNNMTTAAIK